ncbi:MAG: hypothetical protein ACXVBH_10430 [Flavisolibacter sp.]
MYFKNQWFKLLLSLFLLLFTKFSFSQAPSDLMGDWKIIKVELSPNAGQEEKQMLGKMAPIFLKSLFHFKPNNSFSFDSPDKDLSIKDGVWQFDVNKQYIKVTERTSKGTPGQLMGIAVKAANGRYLFQMEETPIILTVTRNN